MEAQPNVSQAWASTSRRPVNSPSRTTASAEPSQPNPPQRQPASSSPQPQTPPETPDHRSHATPEPPGRMPLHTHTPTQASNSGRSLRSHNLPTPPATGKKSSTDDIRGSSDQPPNPVSPAMNGILPQSGRDQSSTPEPNPSHLTSPEPPRRMPLHAHTPTQASNAVSIPSRSLRSHNLPTPPITEKKLSASQPKHNHTHRVASSNLEDRDSVIDQSEDEVPLHTHLPTSTNTPRHPSTTGSSSTVSTNIPYYNGLTPPLFPSSHHRSILRKATVHLHDHLHDLQCAGQCPNGLPLGDEWVEPTSVPGGPTIMDIIRHILRGYMELRYLDDLPDGVARKLLRPGCEENEEGQHFRESLRVWMSNGGTVDEEAVTGFRLEDGSEEGEEEEGGQYE